MPRTPHSRGPLAIGLLVSLAAHAAALVIVTIDVPESSRARLAVVPVRPADLERVEPESPIPVVEIRPPGMRLPAAGGGGGPERAEAVPVATAAPAPVSELEAPVRLTASTRSRVTLAPAAPVARAPEIVLAARAGDSDGSDAEEAGKRPARGIILRTGGGAAPGTEGAAGPGRGRGVLPGTGGVTVVGPGGDCITPGLAVPGGQGLPRTDRLPPTGRPRSGGPIRRP